MPESAQVGKPVGKIKAEDEDVGVNAEIKYSIINQEGANVFSIATDKDTREGIISLKKVPSYQFVYFLHCTILNSIQNHQYDWCFLHICIFDCSQCVIRLFYVISLTFAEKRYFFLDSSYNVHCVCLLGKAGNKA